MIALTGKDHLKINMVLTWHDNSMINNICLNRHLAKGWFTDQLDVIFRGMIMMITVTMRLHLIVPCCTTCNPMGNNCIHLKMYMLITGTWCSTPRKCHATPHFSMFHHIFEIWGSHSFHSIKIHSPEMTSCHMVNSYWHFNGICFTTFRI